MKLRATLRKLLKKQNRFNICPRISEFVYIIFIKLYVFQNMYVCVRYGYILSISRRWHFIYVETRHLLVMYVKNKTTKIWRTIDIIIHKHIIFFLRILFSIVIIKCYVPFVSHFQVENILAQYHLSIA